MPSGNGPAGLGLTPEDRVRIEIPDRDEEDEDDPFAECFGGRPERRGSAQAARKVAVMEPRELPPGLSARPSGLVGHAVRL